MSPASTTPALSLKARSVGGRPPVDWLSPRGDQQAAGQEGVDALGDGRAGQPGERRQLGPGGGLPAADELEDRPAPDRTAAGVRGDGAHGASEPASTFECQRPARLRLVPFACTELLIDSRHKCVPRSQLWGTRPRRCPAPGPAATTAPAARCGSPSPVPVSSARSTPAPPAGPAPAWSAWPPRRPTSAGPPPRRLGAERAFADAEALVTAPTSTSCTSAPPTTSTPAWPRPPWPPASTWCARSRSPSTPPSARRWCRRPRRPGWSPPCRSSTASTRWSARPGPGWPPGRSAPSAWCTAATCRTGWPPRTTTTGASTPSLAGASRAFADIGSHWCDLVEFVCGDRLAAVCAEAVTAVPERVRAGDTRTRLRATRRRPAPTGRAPAPVTTEDISVVLFRTARRRHRVGRGQPGVARAQEPAAVRGRRRRGHARASTRSSPRRCGSGGAPASELVVRDPAAPRPRRRPPTPCCRPAIPRATRTASTPSWPTPTAPSAAGTHRPPSTACPRSPTAPGPPRSPTPCCARRRSRALGGRPPCGDRP